MQQDDSIFEETLKPGITPDMVWMKQHNEIAIGERKVFWGLIVSAILTFFGTVAGYFIHFAVMAAFALVTVFLVCQIFRRWRNEKEDLYEIFEEGLLVPGIIINTNPLTLLVIAPLNAEEEVPMRYGCYRMQVEHLPFIEGELYEKVPCAAMFFYEEGAYYHSFLPYPLCWATSRSEEIEAAVCSLDGEMKQEGQNYWKLLQSLAQNPYLSEQDCMLLLDEDYTPFGYLNDSDEDYELCLNDTIRRKYSKEETQIHYITKNIRAAGFYNEMIDLARQHQVYEYISTHCEDGDHLYYTNSGYFTYMSDARAFIDALKKRRIKLDKEEYPLLGGVVLITSKGCWMKKKFYPWSQVEIGACLDAEGDIETLVNGKRTAVFPCSLDYYTCSSDIKEEDLEWIARLECERINNFLQDLKALCLECV